MPTKKMSSGQGGLSLSFHMFNRIEGFICGPGRRGTDGEQVSIG